MIFRENVAPSRFSAMETLDGRTADYVAAAQAIFGGLQDVIGRLAGVLVLEAMGHSQTVFDGPTLAAAREVTMDATERFRGLRPTPRSAHFNHHLARALSLVRDSVSLVENRRNDRTAARDPLPCLRGAWEELTSASNILPGFEIVDFGQSCCALHVS